MPRSTLEELALRWVPGGGDVDIRPLASGLVNDSFCVSRGGSQYSLRVACADAQDLGLDRGWECRVLRAAAAAGVAPAIEHCDPEHGILVTGWMKGRTWTAAQIQQPEIVDAMAQLLRRVHSLSTPAPPRVMSPADWIAHYEGALGRHGVSTAWRLAGTPARRPAGTRARARAQTPTQTHTQTPTQTQTQTPTQTPTPTPTRAWALALRSGEHSVTAAAQLSVLAAAQPVAPVVCHSDLHRQNLVIGDALPAAEGERAVLLDWEYAHVSDPFWDLAGWAANNDWTDDETSGLAAAYLGRSPEPGELTRLHALLWLYDYVGLLWSELYLTLRTGPSALAVSARADHLNRRLRRVR